MVLSVKLVISCEPIIQLSKKILKTKIVFNLL